LSLAHLVIFIPLWLVLWGWLTHPKLNFHGFGQWDHAALAPAEVFDVQPSAKVKDWQTLQLHRGECFEPQELKQMLAQRYLGRWVDHGHLTAA